MQILEKVQGDATCKSSSREVDVYLRGQRDRVSIGLQVVVPHPERMNLEEGWRCGRALRAFN
jgi:hypothetical protein